LARSHGQAQARIHAQIATGCAGGHRDLADDARPDLAPLFVLPAFTVLNVGPFAALCRRDCPLQKYRKAA
jgi:hypothetical protein